MVLAGMVEIISQGTSDGATPHSLGRTARLLGLTTLPCRRARLQAACACGVQRGCVVVSGKAWTLVGGPRTEDMRSTGRNPALASGERRCAADWCCFAGGNGLRSFAAACARSWNGGQAQLAAAERTGRHAGPTIISHLGQLLARV